MLSEDQKQIRRITHAYWSLPARRQLEYMLRKEFLTDEDLSVLPERVFAVALCRAIANGDLSDLERDILEERERDT